MWKNNEELSKPMFEYWKRLYLVQVRKIDDSLVEAMQRASNPEEWKSQEIKLFWGKNHEMASMCFEKTGEETWDKRAKASGLRVAADSLRGSNVEEARIVLREAAEIFDSIGRAETAAECFCDLGDYERAGKIYLEKCGTSGLRKAGECISLAGSYETAAQHWKQQASSSSGIMMTFKDVDKVGQEFLEKCAMECYNTKNKASRTKFVRAFHTMESKRNFLKSLDYLEELLLLEEESGNFIEAAEIAKSLGIILLEVDLLGKAEKFADGSFLIRSHVFSGSLEAKVATLDARHFASAAQKYQSQEFSCVELRVLDTLSALTECSSFKLLSKYCQSIFLTWNFDIANFFIESKSLDDIKKADYKLQNFLELSTNRYFEIVFPLDPRQSLSENMISLRETEISNSILEKVISRNISTANELTYGQIGRVMMILHGCSKPKYELYDRIAENSLIKIFSWIMDLDMFYIALEDAYNANWRRSAPREFCEAIFRRKKNDNFSFVAVDNHSFVAEAFKVIGDPLVIVAISENKLKIVCPDAIFLDLVSFSCKNEIMKILFLRSTTVEENSSNQGESTNEKSSKTSKTDSKLSFENGKGNLQIIWSLIQEVELEEHINRIGALVSQLAEQRTHPGEDINALSEVTNKVEELKQLCFLLDASSEFDEIEEVLKRLEARKPQLELLFSRCIVQNNDDTKEIHDSEESSGKDLAVAVNKRATTESTSQQVKGKNKKNKSRKGKRSGGK
ncbi:hypothetical protein BUALT_Bualt14G0020400 [Buddleja alternifolia]|uniref:Uncharacterized protein n=1 Tax=Buddleja alternifolia TaxID=168488 RepID=A0AAV6WRG2_9LAMI|nr:hypothetical protein BUALT_Bualt14G0020400 [Buddleja alternifolia]